MWLLSWLIGSKLGRYVALGLLVSAGVAAIGYSLFAKGVARERARQVAASLENLRSRIKTDDEIERMSAAERRRRLSDAWGLPDKR
jgi:hypothetical protein